jgi:excisionase family DNA binding protein
MTTSPPPTLTWSVPDVAKRLGVHENTVRRLIARGELPSLLIGDRRFVRPADVEAWLDQRVFPKQSKEQSRRPSDRQLATT